MPNKQYPAPLWRDAINGYLSYLRAAGQRPESVKTRSRQLVRLSLDLADVRPESVTSSALLEWFESKSWSVETTMAYVALPSVGLQETMRAISVV